MKLKRFCKKNSATILLIVGCVEFGAALWAMRKSAQKEHEYLENVEEDAEIDVMELVKIYAPTALLTVGAVSCFVGGHVLNQKRIKSLSIAYSVLNNRFMNYRKKVDEVFGEGSDEKVMDAVAAEEYTKIQYVHFDDKQLFYDSMMNEFFYSTKEEVKDAIYAINRTFTGGYHDISLNDWLELTGREPVSYGEDYGWNPYMMEALDGAFWIDFDFRLKQLPDGTEYWDIYIPFEANNMYDSFCGDAESYLNIDKGLLHYVSETILK